MNDDNFLDILLKSPDSPIRLRKRSKILEFHNYSAENDEIEYCREKLLSFINWRNEYEEIGNIDIFAKFNTHIETILENRKKYFEITGEESQDIEKRSHKDEIENGEASRKCIVKRKLIRTYMFWLPLRKNA